LQNPLQKFSQAQDKYKLDQYIIQGGKLLLLLDKLEANMDSASQ
jgi:ABC-2 type transport system permease protein